MTQTKAFCASVCLAAALCLAAPAPGSPAQSPRPTYPLQQAAHEGDLEQAKGLLAQDQSQYLRDSALRFAIQAGHTEIAEVLIAHGARYALMIAAEEGNIGFAKQLLARGTDAGERDSALHAAARTGRKEIAELLLTHGADANARRFGDYTPLFVAAAAGCDWNALQLFTNFPLSPWPGDSEGRKRSPANPEAFRDTVELLIRHGADVGLREKQHGFTALHYAAFGGSKEIVAALLDGGAPANPPVPPGNQSSRYLSPLHLAADYGDLAICELLVARGAEVNAKLPTDGGWWTYNTRRTPLHHAVESTNGKLVAFLVEHGAEVNVADGKDETPLHGACAYADASTVEMLLSHGADVNAVDGRGRTALHFAAERKELAIVELLLSHGADADRKNRDGRTPTSIAIQNGSEEIVRLLTERHGRITIHSAAGTGNIAALERLLKEGVDVNRLDLEGRTALHAAANAGQLEAVRWLVDRGAWLDLADDKDRTALSIAIEQAHEAQVNLSGTEDASTAANRHKAVMAFLISRGAKPDFSYGIPQEQVQSHSEEVADLLIEAGTNFEPGTDSKATLLHRAAWWGHKAAVERLIALGADLNARDRAGATPLHAATQEGSTRYWDVIQGPHGDILALLLERGAEVNAANKWGMTALHGAASYGHIEAMRLLLAHGAKVDAVTARNVTPLHCAASAGSIEAMKLLIAQGADPNAMDDEGDTPLLLLFSRGSLLRDEAEEPAKDFALQLIRQGVRVGVQNKEGVTPLQEAAALGFPDLLDAMLTRGASVHQASASGWTALHSAVAGGEAKCVEMLLERGAPVNGLGRLPDMIRLPRFNWPARSPLHLAAVEGSTAIVRMLIEHGADVNARDGAGKTPLHLARENNRIAVGTLLSSRGADPNTPPAEPWSPGRRSLSPISQAQATRNLEIVKSLAPNTPAGLLTTLVFQEVEEGYSELIPLLAAHGADVNAHESLRQETPLHRAVDKRNVGAIKALIAQGADINAKDKNNETPLGAAVYREQKDIVALLLEHGAEVNNTYTNDNMLRGSIPLHIALRRHKVDIAEMLVRAGSNVNASGGYERLTPLHMALDNRALFELMLEHGGRIDAPSGDGMTCLHMVAAAGEEEPARYLLDKGASVNVQDRGGNTPLHLAAKGGHGALCEVLLAHQADIRIKNKKGLLPLHYAQASDLTDIIVDLTPKMP